MAHLVCPVLNGYFKIERLCTLRQAGADTIGNSPDPLKLIQMQDLCVPRARHLAIERRACQRIMPPDTGVEFHPAAEPGVPKSQITGLKYRIHIQ